MFTINVQGASPRGLVFSTANHVGVPVGQPASFTVAAAPFVDTILMNGADVNGITGLIFTDNHNGTATLSGTPVGSGTFTFTFTATNSAAAGGAHPYATTHFTLDLFP